jgi:glycosyltransferase involved in cell wall biosynthesis
MGPPKLARAGASSHVPVVAETAYPVEAPGPRVRIVSFAPHLAEHGVRLVYRPTLTDAEYTTINSGSSSTASKAHAIARGALRTTRLAAERDALHLVHRLRFLTPLPGVEPMRRLDVYDFDDALFIGATMPWHRRLSWLKREAERCRTYIARARLVFAGNEYLADYARTIASRVEVVPSCIDPRVQPQRSHEEREPVRVGWIGSASTSPYVDQVLSPVARINADRVRAKLVLIGATQKIVAPWIEHAPWSIDTEAGELASFDIGLMPMPDTPWTRGKCGYKVLQYFAAGVPAIASPVGVAKSMVTPERGRLASSEGEWLRALEELISDWQIRQALGSAGRAFVERAYSYQRWAPWVAALLRELQA